MQYFRPYFRRNKNRRYWRKKIFLLFGYFILSFFAFSVGIFIYFAKDLPDPSQIEQRQITQSTKIYDRTGAVLLYDVHGEEKRTVVPPDAISQYLKDATVATEDANFYNHFGLDFKGILRAAWYNIRGSKISQGGSTITQQFIKKSLLTDERTFSRKIKEVILSLELEAKYSKAEILGFYLNQIPYGSNAYGAEAAAQTFFNKPAKNLTLAESALLAGLPRAPSFYSPYGSHPEELKIRQEYVLDRMEKLGYISKDNAEAAKKEKLVFAANRQNIKAPHFVMYIKEYLEEKYGQDLIERGGLRVYTTLDWDLQQAGQEIIEQGAKTNQKKYGSYNAALVAIDPQTGQILTMVGSKDYFATSSLPLGCDPGKNCRFEPNVNVTIRDRQPGSSFKPFAYALAFKKGFLPETTLFDLKTEFNSSCPADSLTEEINGLRCYHPDNYDGKFRGPVSLRQALAQSLNVPSVKTLYLAGVEPTIELAQKMGITTLQDRKNYGLALVLGGGAVKLVDEVAAFGVFAAEGIKNEKAAILKIEGADGKVIEEFSQKSTEVLEPQIARLISDVLSDNQSRAPIFGSSSPLYLEARPAAVKTGTSQEYRDAWTIGYTPSLVAGIWAGNNDNSPMSRAGAGMYAAAPLWNEFMKKSYEISTGRQPATNAFVLPDEPEQFNKPELRQSQNPALDGQIFSERKVKIDKISGKLATNMTPEDLIQEVSFQEIHSILYYVNKEDPLAEPPQNPINDPQFFNWELPIQLWAKTAGFIPSQPPTEYDDVHTLQNQPTVRIISPSNNDSVYQKNVFINVLAQAPLGIKQIDFFFDDEAIGADTKEPYTLIFNLPAHLAGAKHTIKVRAYDQALNRQEAEINVYIAAPGIIIEPEAAPEAPPSLN